MSAPRKDWMPQSRAEVCACIAVLAHAGQLTPDDEQHIADYIAFRAARASLGTPPTTERTHG